MRVFKRGKVYHCYVYDQHGERHKRSTHCHDKEAAERVARQLERDFADPDHAAARKATITQALQLLLSTRAEQVRAGRRSEATVKFYQDKAGHWVRLLEHNQAGEYRPFLLARLRPHVIDDFISQRRCERVSDHTISKELVTLRAALKLAKRAGLWRGEIDALFPVAFAPDYRPRERWLPFPEAQRLLAQLQPDHAARVAFILATSAGASEADRAERGDIAGELSSVLVRGTKRETRWRTLPVFTDWQRGLLRHALDHAAGADGRLFAPWGNVRHDLEAACVRAKIARCSPNDLRRTFAHWMRQARVPLELLAPLMGHATTKMLEKVYGKLDHGELVGLLQGWLTGGSRPPDFTALPALPAPHARSKEAQNEADLGAQGRNRTADTRIFNPSLLLPNPRKSKENRGHFRRPGSPVCQKKGAG